MNNGEKKNNGDSKKIYSLLVLIAVVMITTTGGTYAYLALSATNSSAISGNIATGNLSLSVTPADLKTGNTGVMVPQTQAGLSTAMNSTNKCVDGNNNIICKVYTITVTNNSSATVQLNGGIQFSGNTKMPNLYWRKTTDTTTLGANSSVKVQTSAKTNGTSQFDTTFDIPAANGTACYLKKSTDTTNTNAVGTGCTSVQLAKGAKTTYYIVVWIDETSAVQTDTGTWTATVTFQGKDGTGVTSTIKGA